jgi:hypothetical protein
MKPIEITGIVLIARRPSHYTYPVYETAVRFYKELGKNEEKAKYPCS